MRAVLWRCPPNRTRAQEAEGKVAQARRLLQQRRRGRVRSRCEEGKTTFCRRPVVLLDGSSEKRQGKHLLTLRWGSSSGSGSSWIGLIEGLCKRQELFGELDGLVVVSG